MDISPARNFLTLTSRAFETIGLAITSVTLVYFLRLISTIACSAIEQLPLVMTKNDFNPNIFTHDYMNTRHVLYLVFFFTAGIGIRVFGTRVGREGFISWIERTMGYRNTHQDFGSHGNHEHLGQEDDYKEE